MRKFRSKKILKPSEALLQWQKNMLRLIARYSRLVKDQDNGLLPYSWNIGYVDILVPGELQYQEFVCHTNNIVFATMIFESHMLSEQGRRVTVALIEFNNLVKSSGV